MTASVQVKIEAAALSKALKGSPERVRKELSDVLLRAGIAHENVVKRSRFGPYQGRNAGDRLQRRTGALANAYQLTRPDPARLEMVSGIRRGLPGSRYAALQEFGGTVRAKDGGYLTIPTEAALTPAGALSGRYRIRKTAGGYTTDAGDTFIFKSRGGNLLIGIKERKSGRASARGRGRNRELKAFYVLRRQVKIKPRFGFFASWETLEKGLLPKLVAAAARRAVK